jgi:5-methylcytosine-specific restriction endonuclease McrA
VPGRRKLSTKQRLRIFEQAGGRCHVCGLKIQVGEPWDLDHIIALALGGEDVDENLAPVHAKTCHRAKTSGGDVPAIAKAKRREARHKGAYRSKRPMPGGRDSPWKRKMDGKVVRRD